MRISDIIFKFTGLRHRCGLCRVRTFVNEKHRVIVILITDLGNLNPSGSITHFIEVIVKELTTKFIVPKECIIVEHYEPYSNYTDKFSLVTFDKNMTPSWSDLKRDDLLELLSTDESELRNFTRKNEILMIEIENQRVQIDPLSGLSSQANSASLIRQLEIEDNMIRKSELQQLILAGASERQIQSLLKKDLSLLAEVYAHPSYDYICFSEFPINNGCVDFAIFTGVSWMTVILIEVKGADFNIVNQSGYQKFNANIDTAASQIRERLGYIHRNIHAFKEHVHSIRAKVIDGKSLFNSLAGPEPTSYVDPNKDIDIRSIIIGGRTVDDIKESNLRHDFERYSNLPINLESWDSYLRKLRRN